MNRKYAVLLSLITALMLLATCAYAEEWFCPECGTRNEGNFCTNCGERKPDSASKPSGNDISNLKFSLQDNGDVVLSWSDKGNTAPYEVSYEAKYDTGLWEDIKGKSFTLEFLIPGETYTVTVSNGKSEISATYSVPVSVFTDFSSGKKIVLNETTFSISEVNRDKTKQYEFQVHYPQLRNDRSYKGKLVTKTPHGYGGLVWTWSPYTLGSRYSYIYTNFSMYEFLEGIKKDFDDIPTGKYTLEFYLDGELYDDFSFNVMR